MIERIEKRMKEIYLMAGQSNFDISQLTTEEGKQFFEFIHKEEMNTLAKWQPFWSLTNYLPNPKIQINRKYDSFFKENQISFAELIDMQKDENESDFEIEDEKQEIHTKQSDNYSGTFDELLAEKRENLNILFNNLCLVIPNAMNSQLFYNISQSIITIAYFLKLYNGDYIDALEEFIFDVMTCCQVFHPEFKSFISSFTEVISELSKPLALNSKNKLQYVLAREEIAQIFSSKYLICEILYIFYEALAHSISKSAHLEYSHHSKTSAISVNHMRLVQKKLLFFIDYVYKTRDEVLSQCLSELTLVYPN
jgi:hypothetical protein